MTEIDIYKFFHKNRIEYHFEYCSEIKENDYVFFICDCLMSEFRKIISKLRYEDSGIKCAMKDGYFAFWANDVFGDDININAIFEKDGVK